MQCREESEDGMEMVGAGPDTAEPAGVGVETETETSLVEDTVETGTHQYANKTLLWLLVIDAGLVSLKLADSRPNSSADSAAEPGEPEEAQMWTRKEITEFKESIRKEESEAIIKAPVTSHVAVVKPWPF